MKEEFILDMLILNAMNYLKFGDKQFELDFAHWMRRLQQCKGFNSLEETCNYFLMQGEAVAA